MPRKAKDEINEISKEVKEKKTPVKKAAKTTTKKESAKKATTTASKTTKAEKTTKTANKATTKKTNTATAKKEANTTKKSTAKKTAKKEVEEAVKKTTRKAKSVPTEEEEKGKATKKTTRKTSTTASKAKTTAKKTTKKASTTRKTKKAVADLENDVVLENAENGATEKVNVVEYYDLPYRYNQTIVKILAQTPNVLFVYWDISDDDRSNFVSQYGENFFNNTVPVLLVINKTMNYSYEVQINDFANSWYLHVNDANCEYQVELGRRNKENPSYYYVTTSNDLDMPNDHILLENIPNNVLFKNVKTQELVEKPIVNIPFFKDFAKSKDFYKYFKELLNDELEGDGINLNLPSSHTSSSFK